MEHSYLDESRSIVRLINGLYIMAIGINTYSTDKDLFGKSHWWGFPDMPLGFTIPSRDGIDEEGLEDLLTFICQINLEDLAPFDESKQLPRKGMLYFFAALDYYLGDYDVDGEGVGFWSEDAFKVIYCPDISDLHTHVVKWPDGSPATLPAEAMEFVKVNDNESGHKLLGVPFFDEVEQECGDMVSLLQIDEDDRWGLRFFDMGNVNFVIPMESLAARDFSSVNVYLHCM